MSGHTRRQVLIKVALLALGGLSAMARHLESNERLITTGGSTLDRRYGAFYGRPENVLKEVEMIRRINRQSLERLIAESDLVDVEDYPHNRKHRQQRGKRDPAGPKLCHFKICNMGKRRTHQLLNY